MISNNKKLYIALLFLMIPWVKIAAQSTDAAILVNTPKELKFHLNSNSINLAKTNNLNSDFKSADSAFSTIAASVFFLPPEGAVRFEVKFGERILSETESAELFRIEKLGQWRGFSFGAIVYTGDADKIAAREKTEVTIKYPSLTKGAALLEGERKILSGVLNKQHAIYFRNAIRSPIQANNQVSSTQNVKFHIRETGFYKVSVNSILESGFDFNQNAPAEIHIYNRGKEIPIYLHQADSISITPNDAIWFYGERLAGGTGWFNEETDINVYQLTQSTPAGKRYQTKNSADNNSLAMHPGFRQRLHFEIDKEYNHGDSDQDLYISERVDGEGWYWRRFGPGSYIQTFVLPNFIASADVCSLMVNIRGKTSNPVKPNHHLILSINGHALTDTLFSDNADIVFRFAVPSNWMQNGTNTLGIDLPGDTEAANERIDLNWIEAEYTRAFVASSHQLAFMPPPNSAGDSIRFQITNFHENAVHLFNLKSETKYAGGAVNLIGDKYALNFVDESIDSTAYFALTESGLLSPDTLYLDKISDLKSQTNSADVIIIAHKNFMQDAERLAIHRQSHSGLRVFVADIADVYDEFNNGIFSAGAITAFLQYTYANWQKPAPQYVVLFGDGTWDPKKLGGSSVHPTYIPVWGNPVSDNRLVCFDGPDDFLPEMFIGRIPVESPDEAAVIVDKIINYDLSPAPVHIKKFAFLNGGINDYEQHLFRAQSEELISRYIEPNPVAGQPVRIYKGSQGRTVGELQPEILDAFADGIGTFSFSGHAASSTWETMLQNEDITKLQNYDKLPVIFSMTCHTGKFAEPRQISFAEDFMRLPQRGSVAFWGTSGWGWITQDGWLLDGLFRSMAIDSIREVGALVTASKIKLHQSHLEWSGSNVNVIDQYTLFGDPSMQIKLPLQPDLYLSPRTISTVPALLSEADSAITVKIAVENIGLATTDSVDITARIFTADNQLVLNKEIHTGPIGLIDSVHFNWTGKNRRGLYKIDVHVNSKGTIQEARADNNFHSQNFYFYSSSLTIASPQTLTQIAETQPTLIIYNPEITGTAQAFYEFEIDTSSSFTSNRLIQSGPVEEEKLRTGWHVPTALSDGLYFWRSRRISEKIQSPWENASFWIQSSEAPHSFRQSDNFWPKSGTTHATFAKGVSLPWDIEKTRILQVRSLGFWEGAGHCDLIIDGIKINFNNDLRGHNFIALDPATQEVISGPFNFDTFASQAAADSMAEIIENLPERAILLIGIHDEGSVAMTERALQALELYGSSLASDVGFRDSWSMIGVKGMLPGMASELLIKNGLGQAVANDTLRQFLKRGEILSKQIGPALTWQQLVLKKNQIQAVFGKPESNNSTSNVFVDGNSGQGTEWIALREHSQLENLNLSDISTAEYPYLRLRAEFADDDGLDSPLLASWKVSYQPAGDIIIDPGSMAILQDSLLAGETMKLTATFYAFDAFLSDSVFTGLYLVENANVTKLIGEKKIKIPANGAKEIVFDFSLAKQGENRLKLAIDNRGSIAEINELNNAYEISVFVGQDENAPGLEILVDEQKLIEGEYVSINPTIICDVFDDSPAAISDTSNFHITLDTRRVNFAASGDLLEFIKIEDGKHRAQIIFRPQLTPGNHIFSVLVTDDFGYTNVETLSLQVAEKFALQNVLNYPNPFEFETNFTFFLTQEANSVFIKIYTISGKLIQVLEDYAPEIGFNQLLWDGRDRDNDILANGVYLFKIIAKTDTKSVEFIGKVAVAR
ncbi:MAG: T9SS C-terminal target domain-containing protein [Calditrichaeota bacterium]|nr:MAG: T9SS C-terminal target domain-containing protein [Calditrichota bacterium]